MQPNQNIGVTEKDTTTDCYWLIDSSLLQEDHLSQDEEMERYILVYNYHGMHIRKSIVQHSVTLKFREPLQSLKVITAAHCLLPTGGYGGFWTCSSHFFVESCFLVLLSSTVLLH